MIELLLVCVLVLLNGFFALSEMSVVTARRSKLKQMAEHSRGARGALALAEQPETFLSTVQIGITLIGVLTGVFGGEAIGTAIGHWLGATLPVLAPWADAIGLGTAVCFITFISLIFGELVPKRLALTQPERIASAVALPMRGLARATAPAVALLSLATRTTLRLLGLGRSEASQVSEEEIRMLLAESHEQGVIDTDERNMLNRVLGLGDRRVGSLMTPRPRIVALDTEAPLEDNLAALQGTPFSIYPVFRGADHEVVGLLEAKLLAGRPVTAPDQLFGALRPALFVPESTRALDLIQQFRDERQTLALVVDEYGDLQGLVTLNDVLGAVAGRIQAQDAASDDTPVVRRADGSLLLDGSLPTDDLRELLGLSTLPAQEDHDYHTVAGMCITHFGRIPHTGESFEWAGWRFEVIDLDGARIDKLLVHPPREPVADPDAPAV